jgi:molybdopterin/thiamine biosynthesis adenylyltransferase
MADISCTVIGAGGVGGRLLDILTQVLNYGSVTYQFDEAFLKVVDGDTYEARNRDRQKFHKDGNKAEVTVEKLQQEYETVNITAHGKFLTEDNIKDVIVENDVVFCCVDNHATRLLVSKHCQSLNNITLISGGNELFDGNVQAYVRRAGVDITPTIEEFHGEIAQPKDKNPAFVEKKPGCDALMETHPQLLIVNNRVASIMLELFQEHLLETIGKVHEIFFDSRTQKQRPKVYEQWVKAKEEAEKKKEENKEELVAQEEV